MADQSTIDSWNYTYGLMSTGGVALLIYEHIITFHHEINLFWRGKFNAASILFIANRYLVLISNTGALPWLPWIDSSSSESCRVQFYLLGTIGALQCIPWAALSALRAYVLSQQNWTAALSVFVLSAGPLVYSLVGLATSKVYSISSECSGTLNLTVQANELWMIIAKAAVVIADILVIFITWHSTYRTIKFGGPKSPLAEVLFKNGVLCFIVLLLLHSGSLILILVPISSVDSMGMLNLVGGLGSVFIDLFTPILISRFLIDLQTANRRSQHINILSDIEISNIEGFIGSLGTSLPGNIPAHAEQDDCRHNGMVQDDHTWDTDSHA